MTQILASVGRGCQNRHDDVIKVQQLINNKLPIPLERLAEDGRCGPKTIFAIEEYQRRNRLVPIPDGRVDPTGPTLKSLSLGGASPPPIPPMPPPPIPTGPVAIGVAKPAKMREAAWRYLLAFTKKHEGAVFHMYNNRTANSTKDDVTCGIGFLIDPRSEATKAWLREMFYDKTTRAPANDVQMLADWDAASRLSRTGQNLGEYGKVCQLLMYPDLVYERMALILRDQKLPALLNHSSCRDDFQNFEQFPAAAQVFSLSFAYGRIPFDFPRMRAAIRAGKWAEAASQCRVAGQSERKNMAHRDLLIFAQGVVDQRRSFDELPSAIL